MLADLDETVRGMLKEQLERHGFEGIEIAFDAPTREWSSQLSHPAVSLFLYDMREAEEHRASPAGRSSVFRRRVDRGAPSAGDGGLLRDHRDPAPAVEDEEPPAALAGARRACTRSPRLPQAVLNGRLKNGSQHSESRPRRPGEGRQGGSFSDRRRRAVQGFAGLRRCGCPWESGVEAPDPRSAHRPSARGWPTGRPPRWSRCTARAARSADADGEPLANVWIALPDSGRWTASGPQTGGSCSTA